MVKLKCSGVSSLAGICDGELAQQTVEVTMTMNRNIVFISCDYNPAFKIRLAEYLVI